MRILLLGFAPEEIDLVALLVGVGAIGARTAVLASALGMQVEGIRRDPSREVAGVAAMYGPDQLWSMENVIITTHYAGATPRYDERAMAIFLDNLRRYRAGAPLRNVVDKHAGY